MHRLCCFVFLISPVSAQFELFTGVDFRFGGKTVEFAELTHGDAVA